MKNANQPKPEIFKAEHSWFYTVNQPVLDCLIKFFLVKGNIHVLVEVNDVKHGPKDQVDLETLLPTLISTQKDPRIAGKPWVIEFSEEGLNPKNKSHIAYHYVYSACERVSH